MVEWVTDIFRPGNLDSMSGVGGDPEDITIRIALMGYFVSFLKFSHLRWLCAERIYQQDLDPHGQRLPPDAIPLDPKEFSEINAPQNLNRILRSASDIVSGINNIIAKECSGER